VKRTHSQIKLLAIVTDSFVKSNNSKGAGSSRCGVPLILDFCYRPDVDGLRAVAVLAVVFFHAGLGFPGGYVGVDVFFVISGYLITSLIIIDLQEGRFTLANFWERRARRIIPALAAVVVATLIAGWFLFLPRDYAALGKSAAYQSVVGANFYFLLANLSGYFAGASDEMPLLHTWSLAVEEQFYLFVPLTFTVIFRFHRLWTLRVLLVIFGVGIFYSFCWSLYGVAHHRAAAFYLLPTRAWELLVGSVLAVIPLTCIIKRRSPREIVSYVGLSGILLPCLFYNENTAFPGFAALPPCLGAALIIWSNSPLGHDTTPTSLGRLLASRLVVLVGIISYSLYLWHWPVIAFSKYYWAGEPLSLGYRMSMIAFGIGLALLSWRFIESPFRLKAVCASRKSIYLFSFTALVTSLAIGATILFKDGIPERLPEKLRATISEIQQDDPYYGKELVTSDIIAGKLVPLGVRDSSQVVSVVVWGDSHAMAACSGFDAFLMQNGVSGQAAIHSATAPVLGYFIKDRGLRKDSLRFSEEVVGYIAKKRIPHVVLVANWSWYVKDQGDSSAILQGDLAPNLTKLQSALLTTVKKLVSVGSQPWIFLRVPEHVKLPSSPQDITTLFRRSCLPLAALNDSRYCDKSGPYNGIDSGDLLFLDKLRNAGAKIIDPRSAFLNPSQSLYLISLDGVLLYRDNGHLTKLGAEKVLVPVLEKSFLPFLKPPTEVR
jgi:peptidoglycan/LPS O-acetylase OafA/YrhL